MRVVSLRAGKNSLLRQGLLGLKDWTGLRVRDEGDGRVKLPKTGAAHTAGDRTGDTEPKRPPRPPTQGARTTLQPAASPTALHWTVKRMCGGVRWRGRRPCGLCVGWGRKTRNTKKPVATLTGRSAGPFWGR